MREILSTVIVLACVAASGAGCSSNADANPTPGGSNGGSGGSCQGAKCDDPDERPLADPNLVRPNSFCPSLDAAKCDGFDAAFGGDTMFVHLDLSVKHNHRLRLEGHYRGDDGKETHVFTKTYGGSEDGARLAHWSSKATYQIDAVGPGRWRVESYVNFAHEDPDRWYSAGAILFDVMGDYPILPNGAMSCASGATIKNEHGIPESCAAPKTVFGSDEPIYVHAFTREAWMNHGFKIEVWHDGKPYFSNANGNLDDAIFQWSNGGKLFDVVRSVAEVCATECEDSEDSSDCEKTCSDDAYGSWGWGYGSHYYLSLDPENRPTGKFEFRVMMRTDPDIDEPGAPMSVDPEDPSLGNILTVDVQ